MDEHKLSQLPLFSALGKRELREIAALTDEVEIREGEELLHQGDFAHEFMVVIDGRADVVRDGETVADLGPDDFLGEMAALDMGHRNATVVAGTPMRVAVMTARDLRHIAREMPEVDAQLREAARERCPIAA
jgi:CRP/FNR family transcriptional regulator, cyclic AMP receptor protein